MTANENTDADTDTDTNTDMDTAEVENEYNNNNTNSDELTRIDADVTDVSWYFQKYLVLLYWYKEVL